MIKSIKPEEFFKQIAIHSGVSDIKTVKDIYYGMIRTISRELKSSRTIDLPDWGEFYLHVYKERKNRDVNDRTLYMLPPKTIVKFSPNRNVKKYFYSFGEESTML